MGSVWVVLLGVAVLAALAWGGFRLLAGKQGERSLGPGMVALASGHSQLDQVTPRGYSPRNVGNDASARPWESAYDQPAPSGAVGVPWMPPGFDVDEFLSDSKTHFVSLQDAWNRADTATLRAMMTADMLDQIQPRLTEREQQASGASKTEVIMVDARLLGIEDLGQGHMASVEFSGLLREDGAGPSPFREIWSISRAKSGDGSWLVAAVQALQ